MTTVRVAEWIELADVGNQGSVVLRSRLHLGLRVAAVGAVLATALAPALAHADPDGAAGTCAASCKRIAECDVMGYRACADACTSSGNEDSKAGRETNAAMTRASCEQLTARFHKKPVEARRGDEKQDNCAPVCERFQKCKLWSHDGCMSFCSSHTTDPKRNLAATQWSCQRLDDWMQSLRVTDSGSGSSGSGQSAGGWVCRADGTSVRTWSNIDTPSTTTAYGNGRTRDEAALKAQKDCGSLLNLEVTVSRPSGTNPNDDARVTSPCRVIQCSQR